MLKLLSNTKSTIFLIIMIYLSLAIFNINYPGLSSDEACNGVISNYIFKNISDNPPGNMAFINCYHILFRKIFPIMGGDYYGSIMPYLIYPFIRIFGLNAFSLRFSSISILVIFLLLVYQLCKIWFGKRVGLLSVLLTATNLIFVQYSRVGLYRVEIFVMFFFWSGLFFLIKYSQNKKYFSLFLSFFLFGLGLSTKITFLYYIVASILAYSIIGKRLNLLGSFNIKKAIIMLLSFCLGAFFIIIYNIKEPWKTVKLLFAVLIDPNSTGTHTTGMAANNLAYFNNLNIRLADLFAFLKGDISSRLDWGVTKICFIESISPIVMGLTIVSLVSILFLALFSPNLPKIIKYRISFLYIIYSIIFFLTPFTLSSFNQGHLLVLLPFPQVVIALFLGYIWRRDEQRKIVFVRIFGLLLIISTLLFNIWMNIYFNIQMKKTGGYNRWSTAVVDLADYLQKNNISSPVMFSYGLDANLMFLTDNRVIPVIYDKFYPQTIVPTYRQLLLRSKQIFYLTMVPEESRLEDLFIKFGEQYEKKKEKFSKVFFAPLSEESPSYLNLFMRLAKDFGKKKVLEKIFLNRAGHPVYWLYKIY